MKRLTIQAKATSAGKRLVLEAYHAGQRLNLPNYRHPVVIELDGLEMPDSVVTLVDHENRIGAVAGSVAPYVCDGILWAEGNLADSEAGRVIAGLFADDVPLGSSVTVEPIETRDERDDDGKTITRVLRGTLLDISIVPIGADTKARAILASLTKDFNMSFEEFCEKLDMNLEGVSEDEKATLQKSYDAIYGEGDTDTEEETETATPTATASRPMATHSTRQLQALRDATPTAPVVRGGQASATVQARLTAGLWGDQAAADIYGERQAEAARRAPVQSFGELERAYLQASNQRVGNRAENMRSTWIQAVALSTGSLARVTADSMEKMLIRERELSQSTHKAWTDKLSPTSYHDSKPTAINLIGTLEEVGEGGEVKHASLTDTADAISIGIFAKNWTIGEKTIRNDDIDAIAQLPRQAMKAANQTIQNLVYNDATNGLLANPGSYFASGNGNLLTAALSIESLGDAIEAMREQTDENGHFIDVQPAVLLVPPALEATAKAIIGSNELNQTGANVGTSNPWQNVVQVIVEPRISLSSDTEWYLLAGPGNGGWYAAFLDGRDAPIVEHFGPEQHPDNFATSWRVSLRCGAGPGDYRCGVKSTGAG